MAGNTFYGRAMAVRAAIAAAMCAAMASSNVHARSLLYHYDFDKVENGGLVYSWINSGSGTAELIGKFRSGNAIPYSTSGAFGSSGAYKAASSQNSLWLGDGSASLGCGTEKGFTISFWMKTMPSHIDWTNPLGFRVGGVDYRVEYTGKTDGSFAVYAGTSMLTTEDGGTSVVDAQTGVWKHYAFVFRPNCGTTAGLGTCSVYVDGEYKAAMTVAAAGNLQQLHIGSWVRQNGGDRSNQYSNSEIDEVAIYDYPATAENVKWLSRNKPAPDVVAMRAMPVMWPFDESSDNGTHRYNTSWTSGLWPGNAGSGTDSVYRWKGQYWTGYTSPGALGTSKCFALRENTVAGSETFRVDGASVTEGLGANLLDGAALSFWIKAPANLGRTWQKILSFQIGSNKAARFEWQTDEPAIQLFGTPTSSTGKLVLKPNEWTHVCMNWNRGKSAFEFYVDGVSQNVQWVLANPTSADVFKSFAVGIISVYWNNNNGVSPADVYVDEPAIFNHSLSDGQIAWLCGHIPEVTPLDTTNLVRTVSADATWAADGGASWTVRKWDDEGETWADTELTLRYPTLEDCDVESSVTFASDATLTVDTVVTGKKISLLKSGDAATVSPALALAEGARFDPSVLNIADGLQLTVPLYAVNMGGALTLGVGSKIVFDTANYGDVGGRGATALPVTNAMSVGSFVLPEGESDVLSHFGVTDSRFTLSLSADGNTILVAADTIPVVATWTGAGDGTSIGSAANWECRNAAGAKVDDALPCANTRVIVSSGTAAMNVPVGTTLPWSYLGLEAGSVTLAAETDWRGLPALAIPEGTTISLGGNNLYLNGTVTGRGTFTDAAAAGGELHFDVADGATFANEQPKYHAAGSFALTGTLKLVKDGAGVFVAARTGQTYSGGTDVQNGMFRFGAQPYSRILGSADGVVTVSADGTLDMNGQVAAFQHQFVLNGGIIQNAGADRDVAYSQFANIRLGADSTILPTSSMGVVGDGYAATTLDLGGHTLTIPIANGKILYLANTEIKNGLVDVTSGGWLCTGKTTPGGTSNNDIIATNADFRINGALRLYAKIRARSYEAIYAYDYNDCAAVIEVNGTFKPSAHDYFRGCTMMDGSIIDLSSRTNALPIVSAFTSGANTLGFEAGKTVHVKFGGYHANGSEPVISWAAKPVDIDTVKFRSAPGEMARGFIKKDDGLYITCGFMILVR